MNPSCLRRGARNHRALDAKRVICDRRGLPHRHRRLAMHESIRHITDAGFLLQIDDPDLADAWQIHGDMDVPEYRKFAALRIDALNYALRDIPEESVRFQGAGSAIMARISTISPCGILSTSSGRSRLWVIRLRRSNSCHDHEWQGIWQDVRLPEGSASYRGRWPRHGFRRAPGVGWHSASAVKATLVGRERVIAGTDCGLGTRGPSQDCLGKIPGLAGGARLATRQLWRWGCTFLTSQGIIARATVVTYDCRTGVAYRQTQSVAWCVKLPLCKKTCLRRHSMSAYTPAELMVVAAAHRIHDYDVAFCWHASATARASTGNATTLHMPRASRTRSGA